MYNLNYILKYYTLIFKIQKNIFSYFTVYIYFFLTRAFFQFFIFFSAIPKHFSARYFRKFCRYYQNVYKSYCNLVVTHNSWNFSLISRVVCLKTNLKPPQTKSFLDLRKCFWNNSDAFRLANFGKDVSVKISIDNIKICRTL